MAKKRGLGKSLDALLSYTNNNTELKLEETGEKLSHLALDVIQRGKYQPRREIEPEALQELADSIRAQGIIQPIVVRPLDGFENKYEIIAGERRWRAAKIAGLQEIPALIRPLSDESAIAIALIENIQRKDLNPIEEAIALQRLIEEFKMTHQQIADAVGKSRTAITNLLRLLSLSHEVKMLLEKNKLEMGHARALLPLPDMLQLKAAEMIVNKNLSVRETEELVKQLQNPKQRNSKQLIDPNIRRLQENLSMQFKLPVIIQSQASGKGKLVIRYKNLAELDRLLECFDTV